MSDFAETLFGPLSGEWCNYFYFLSILIFVLFVIYTLSMVYVGVSKKRGLSYFGNILVQSIPLLVAYMVNRLMYSMCSKVL